MVDLPTPIGPWTRMTEAGPSVFRWWKCRPTLSSSASQPVAVIAQSMNIAAQTVAVIARPVSVEALVVAVIARPVSVAA
jgi:hypothetical protein